MRNLRRLFMICLCLISTTAVGAAQDSPDDLIIKGGQVFDSDKGVFRKNDAIVIRNGRIVSLSEPTDQADPPHTIALEDEQYILPGLIDLHAHYNVKLITKRREEFHVMPIVYLANGVTVTFSAGEYDPEGMHQLRQRLESGEQIGPRLLTSGPYFGRVRPGWRTITDDQIAADVEYWTKRGVAGFKAKAIGPDHLETLIREAHLHGLTVTGHLDSGYRGSVNPRDAIHMGIDRIEHFLGGDAMPADKSAYGSLASITTESPGFREIVELYIANGTWFDCTITAFGYFGRRGEEFDYWQDERLFFTPFIQSRVKDRPYQVMQMFADIYEAKLKTIAEFHRQGGLITLGTDHFSNGEFLPGFGAHREMDALVRAGIPPADVIRIATINGAQAMRIEEDHGSIATGKVADLFIIRGNPLENIRNTRNVMSVVRAGQIYDSEKLFDSVRGKLGPKDESEMSDW